MLGVAVNPRFVQSRDVVGKQGPSDRNSSRRVGSWGCRGDTLNSDP